MDLSTAKRFLIKEDPFTDRDPQPSPWGWSKRGLWAAKWVRHPSDLKAPFVTAYCLRFKLGSKASMKAHVSADERYELFLDGRRVGRGSERGDVQNWYFESYDLSLSAGAHVLVARVWTLGALAPFAQMSLRPGFIFAVEGKHSAFSTGTGAWKVKVLGGHGFPGQHPACFGTGTTEVVDGAAYDWGYEKGSGDGWLDARPEEDQPGNDGLLRNEFAPTRLMRPGTLPAMLDKVWGRGRVRFMERLEGDPETVALDPSRRVPALEKKWQALLSGKAPLVVPPRSRWRVVVDLEDYVCAYPELTCSGGKGSSLRLEWQESLFSGPEGPEKGNRGLVDGKFFRGLGDTFLPDGSAGRVFGLLWWRSGRYLQFLVKTGSQALTIEKFSLRETRYPWRFDSKFSASDTRLGEVIPVATRALEMCSHETYFDCPFYEQLMYVGDTRLEVLASYALSADGRLPEKAIRLFDASRLPGGLTQSRYPSRVTQVIPPFSLWWVAMVHDHAAWRNDPGFIRSCLPGVRSVLQAFLGFRNKAGLLDGPVGWNFMDWVPGWEGGVPAQGELGVSGPVQWQFIYALKLAAELESWAGEPELAARNRRLAAAMAEAVIPAFWSARHGLFADDLKKSRFSEHSQCLALLGGALKPALRDRVGRELILARDLDPTTIYFRHYLFEAFRLLGKGPEMLDRMDLWFQLKDLDCKTTLEAPEPGRSDCHAWGAHPVYHYFTTILGIRPVSMGFAGVEIAPQLGTLAWARGEMVHPLGMIKVELEKHRGGVRGQVELPRGLSGKFKLAGKEMALRQGRQALRA